MVLMGSVVVSEHVEQAQVAARSATLTGGGHSRLTSTRLHYVRAFLRLPCNGTRLHHGEQFSERPIGLQHAKSTAHEESTVNHELLACGITSAGNADPGASDPVSPEDLRYRVECAGRLGWSGMGLLHSDVVSALNGMGLLALDDLLRANGIKHVELELLDGWWQGEANSEAWARRETLLSAAPVLGAGAIKITADLTGEPVGFEVYVRELRRLADSAQDLGTRIAMEFMPFAHFSDARSAARLIGEVDHQAAGLCVDIWHVHRSGMSYEELIASIPPDRIFLAELGDAALYPQGTLREDSRRHRRYPGEGQLDVPRFVHLLVEAGFDSYWGVEILSDTHRASTIEEGLRHAYDSSVKCLNAADVSVQ